MTRPIPSSSSKTDGGYVVEAPRRSDGVADALRAAYDPPRDLTDDLRRAMERLRLAR